MADKFETNKHFHRFMWALLCLGFVFGLAFILKYLPALILALK